MRKIDILVSWTIYWNFYTINYFAYKQFSPIWQEFLSLLLQLLPSQQNLLSEFSIVFMLSMLSIFLFYFIYSFFLIFSGICVFSCKCFLVRSKNFLAMLILTLYENSGLYQTFLTCFVVYLRYCDLSYKTYLLRVSTILGNIVVVIGGYIENVHITGIDGDTF